MLTSLESKNLATVSGFNFVTSSVCSLESRVVKKAAIHIHNRWVWISIFLGGGLDRLDTLEEERVVWAGVDLDGKHVDQGWYIFVMSLQY